MDTRRRFTVVIEQDEDDMYVATVPALRGCHTQAPTIEALIARIREAIELCLEVEELDEPPLQFIGVQQIEVAA
ncbi:MAG: type II toxin-antitoxin system HicB family antitoxin [Caldilineaceae bacterium]|nr:type II toxin-antitoxin system HicB family antitoxin [Caldilineaceae bacterium]